MEIFLLIPLSPDYQDIYQSIEQATIETGFDLIRVDEVAEVGVVTEAIQKQIEQSKLIIADVSDNNPNVMYELGFALALKKPFIIISRKGESIPFDISLSKAVIYDRKRLKETLGKPLRNILAHIDSEELIVKELIDFRNQKEKLKTVFVSYSHVDLMYLERLEIHLKPFEKSGQIELWSDTRIKAGEKWKERIEHSLNKAVIALLLISADFLASDFIVDNELPPLLRSAEERGTVIVPIILKPCRFTSNPNLAKFQAINDPKIPLSKMDENAREELFVKIADYIDSLI